ncbi:MAG TPA: sulfatase [Thermoanaerobaculia bacterium]|nr:sulfatase [Thermoanaerobaculia bacterium]
MTGSLLTLRTRANRTFLLLLAAIPFMTWATPAAAESSPNVLMISVDTLRADRLSSYGYGRNTSPNIDRLLARGARFEEARTVEPLTGPAMATMLTSRHPHEHGATRNALKIKTGLSSVSKILRRRGYITAAFVSNWVLRGTYSGLDDHFHEYHEVLTRKRWLGMFKGESYAEDVTEAVIDWLDEREDERAPFFIWAHYTDPHAPYLYRSEHAKRLNIPPDGRESIEDRYDTEIAAVDAAVGDLLEAIQNDPRLRESTLVVFTSDHGESFGEHGVWGHGRFLWEEAVRIPLGFVLPGRIRPRVIEEAARIIDIAPTILGLAEVPVPEAFLGFDWSGVLRSNENPPILPMLMQAHRGSPVRGRNPQASRQAGLLEIAVVHGSRKESWRTDPGTYRVFDLRADPAERNDLAGKQQPMPPSIGEWLAAVHAGLRTTSEIPAALDAEAVEKLRSLGYLE